MTEAQIRLQLTEENDERITRGRLNLHDVSPAAMLIELLEIESQQ